MMNTRCVFICSLLLASLALVHAQQAVAVFTSLQGSGLPNLKGTATLTPGPGNNVTVMISVVGLNLTSSYAIHIHQYGDFTDKIAGESAGAHYNPFASATHGCPETSSTRFAGELGNFMTDAGGSINQAKSVDLVALTGNASVLGRAIVLHLLNDSCDVAGDPSPNPRLAMGIIGLANATTLANNTDLTVVQLVTFFMPTLLNPNVSSSGILLFNRSDSCPQTIAGTSPTHIFGTFSGVSLGHPGHGLHIHMFGDLTNVNGTAFGSHWGLSNEIHNLPQLNNSIKHQGDFGNVKNADSTNTYGLFDRCDTYIADFNQIVGRGVVFHSTFDHGDGASCDQAGNSGLRYLIGVIGVANPAYYVNNSATTLNIILSSNYDNTADSAVTCVIPTPPANSSHPAPSSAARVIANFSILFFAALILVAMML